MIHWLPETALVQLNNDTLLLGEDCAHFENHGYSLYTTVRKDTNEFIGFIGLLIADFKAHFTPATEIGWRLSSNHWGQGFATESAKPYEYWGLEVSLKLQKFQQKLFEK